MTSNLVEDLVGALDQKNHRVAFAESCTGGLLSSWLTKRSGVSSVFQGSVVAYSNQVKAEVLGVGQKDLEQFGAVSEVVARQMAAGASRVLHSDWAVSITGIAGPNGGTPDKPVGLVCFGLFGPKVAVEATQNFSGSREEIQTQSAEFALQLLLDHMPS